MRKMNKALLVIDMQNVCVGADCSDYFSYDRKALIRAVNKVIGENDGNMIIYIRNVMKKGLLSRFAPFEAYEGSDEVKLVDGLDVVSENILAKYKGDAFSNPALNTLLKANNIECVELVGVDGGGCVALTALGAVKAGYSVTVNDAAIGTMFKANKRKLYKKLEARGAQIVNENTSDYTV